MTAIQRLWQTHQDVIRLAAGGASPTRIAQATGMEVDHVTGFLSSQVTRDRVAAVREEGSDGR